MFDHTRTPANGGEHPRNGELTSRVDAETRTDQRVDEPESSSDLLARTQGLPLDQLVEVLSVDQCRRWQQGQRIPAEAYFQLHPEILNDSEHAFELIYGEFLLREESGEVANLDEFCWRFPRQSERLQRQLAVHQQLHSLETLKGEPLEGVFDGPPTPTPPRSQGPRLLPHLPGYEVLEELGRGGMGVVYRAHQVRLDREVALKMVRPDGAGDQEMIARLLSEARAVARLRHPHIVQIFSVGDLDGRPFIEMEYLEGGSLSRLLDGQPWASRDAARLVEKLALAISEAHQIGIVHRDLKPANVLFTADGSAKIADFGLAKQLGRDSDLTRSEQLLGSPSYMAPEQTWGGAPGINTAADIYSLGAILYELLTGRPPFRGMTVLHTLEQVRHAEPAQPSRLQPGLERDIDTICLKCLEKDPDRRYDSAIALAADLERFIAGKAIQARRAGPIERVLRWSRREPRIALLIAALFLSLSSGFAGVLWKWREATEAHQQAVQVGEESRRITSRLSFEKGLGLAEAGEPAKGLHWMLEALRSAPAADSQQRRMIRRNITAWAQCVHSPTQVLPHGDIVPAVAFSPDGTRIATGCENSTVTIRDFGTGQIALTPLKTQASVHSLAFSPHGRRLAVGEIDGTIEIFEMETGQKTASFATGLPGLGELRFEPDGRAIWARHEETSGGLCRRFDTSDGTPRPLPKGLQDPLCLPVARDDGTVLVLLSPPDAKEENSYQIWNSRTGSFEGKPLKPSADYQPLGLGPEGRTVAFVSRSGKWLDDCWVRFWSLDSGQPLGPPIRHLDMVRSWAFSPDGLVFASSGTDREVHFWNVPTSRPLGSPLVHEDHVLDLAFAPDGRSMLTGSYDTTARLWELGDFSPLTQNLSRVAARTRGESPRELKRSPFARAEFGPDRRTVLMRAGSNWLFDPQTIPPSPDYGLVRLVDVASALPRGATLGPPDRYVGAIAFSPDASLVATCTFPGSQSDKPHLAHLWDARSGQCVGAPMPLPGKVYPWATTAMAFSPDHSQLAIGHIGGGVEMFEVPTGRPLLSLPQGEGVFCVAFSPDGRILAVGTKIGADHKGWVRLWDLGTGQQIGPSLPHPSAVWRILFRPDGRALLTDSGTSSRLWSVETGQPLGQPMPSGFGPGGVGGATFLPDGSAVLLGRDNGEARLWNARTGQPVAPPMKNHRPIVSLDIDPDGELAVLGLNDGTLRLWDLRTASPLGPVLSADSAILSVTISRDGRSILAATADGSLRTWPVPVPVEGPEEFLEARLIALTGCRKDSGGSISYINRDFALDPDDTRKLVNSWPLPRDPNTWHDRNARQAESEGMPEAALWHLDRLIASQPDLWTLRIRQAHNLALAGRLDEASQAYQKASSWISSDKLAELREHDLLNCLAAGRDDLVSWHLHDLAPTHEKK